VLFGALALFVGYGVWRGRGERNLTDFLLAGRGMAWPTVALSVMATQAGPVTFISTPGQGYADGLRFVQFYFGLPLAMIVLCVTAVPLYARLRVFTAYEYLEGRFGGGTRTLTALLFLIQRGLSAGLTIYAPALVLAVILGWEVRWTCVLLGALAVIYTTSGGSKAVGYAHALMFTIIMATMAIVLWKIAHSLPAGVTLGDAKALAAQFGRVNPIQTHFDPKDRYNLWSGLIGGFFLQLSYFGTDQSQVGRYLTGRSVAESRRGLIANAILKIPMQFAILSLGVLVFVFYLFVPAPLSFNPLESARMESGPSAAAWHALQARHRAVQVAREGDARAMVAARHGGDRPGESAAAAALAADQRAIDAARGDGAKLILARDPGAQTSDTNYVFLSFVLAHLPIGLIGLVFAAIFAASMNSSSAELNSLASTTVVDFVRRFGGRALPDRQQVWASRIATLVWAGFAVAFAETCSRLGSLIEAVNILGSLFYGTILGIFLVAFYLPRVGGRAVCIAALIAEAAVIACFRFGSISFLWYNVIGCGLVVVLSLALQPVGRRGAAFEAQS
jgi:sodium-dependent multivitamin transporter 6